MWKHARYVGVAAAALLFFVLPAPAQVALDVRVDAAQVSGPSTVGEILGAHEGYPNNWDRWARDWRSDPAVAAFRASGLKYIGIGASFEAAPGSGLGIPVTKVGNRIRLDFTYWDSQMADITTRFQATPKFILAWMPKALSRNPSAADYYVYPPQYWADWQEVVRQFVEHNHKPKSQGGLGLRWAAYEVWSEPEDASIWKGTLEDYVELYARSVAGLQAAAPSMPIGGPVTAHWDSVTAGGHQWGLPQFLGAAKERNLRIDFISWHHYWSERLSDGMDFVDDVVARLGYPRGARYAVTEWSSEIGDEQNPCAHQRYRKASHLANNVIRELVGPSSKPHRRLWQAYWYLFKTFDKSDESCSMAMITAPPPGDAKFCRHTTYATVQMLGAMQTGDFIATTAAPPLVAMGTRQGASAVRALVNNHTGTAQSATVTFSNLPFGPQLTRKTQLVGATQSNGCAGLEAGSIQQVTSSGGGLEVALRLPPYGSALVTLAPSR